MYQNSNAFLVLEERAVTEGIFVDYEVPAAVPGFSVVKCVACTEDGRRRTELAQGSSVYQAKERAALLALTKLFNEALTKEAEAVFIDKDAAKQDTAVTKGTNTVQKATPAGSNQTARNGSKVSEMPKGSEKNAGSRNNSGQTTTSAQVTDASVSSNRAPDDFRVNLSSYNGVKNNYITDLLSDDKGRRFLKQASGLPNPHADIAEMVDKIKAYLQSHQIVL